MASKFKYNDYKESSAVTNARKALQNGSTYKESNEVKTARNNLNNLQAPGEYSSKYQQNITDIMDQISNRKPFTYDLNGDALYQQYKQNYITQGQMAMMDTMGQASAMTGGYGNSYASTAGNQAYQSYLQNLNDVVPELYQMALDKYNSEGQDLYNQYGMYSEQEQYDYGKYRDTVSDYQTNRNYLTDVYNNARNFDYTKFSDNRSFLSDQYNNERTFDYSQYGDAYQRAFANYQQGVSEDQYAKDYALQQAQLAEEKRQFDATMAYNKSKSTTTTNNNNNNNNNNNETSVDPKSVFSGWGASEWEGYFAKIRNTEGKSAAETELNKLIKDGTIPTNCVVYASLGARGQLGH